MFLGPITEMADEDQREVRLPFETGYEFGDRLVMVETLNLLTSETRPGDSPAVNCAFDRRLLDGACRSDREAPPCIPPRRAARPRRVPLLTDDGGDELLEGVTEEYCVPVGDVDPQAKDLGI